MMLIILTKRLQYSVGLTGPVLNLESAEINIFSGFPHRSILEPLLFNFYILLLGNIIKKHSVSYYSYVGDTQLLCLLKKHNINYWMSKKCLQLNKDKTEILVVGSKNRNRKFIHTWSHFLWSTASKSAVILDSHLSFGSHVSN